MELLRVFLSGISAQRPAHTYFVGGEPLPVEARIGGLFVGFLVCLLFLVGIGRARAAVLPSGIPAVVLLGAILSTCLEGANALLFDLGQPHLYTPLLALRLATGLAAGFGLAAFAAPILASTFWAEPAPDSSIEGSTELVVGAGILVLVVVLFEVGAPALFWPLAILQAVAVIGVFTVADLYLIGLLVWRRGRAQGWSDLAPLAAVALTVALAKLAFLAYLRSMAG